MLIGVGRVVVVLIGTSPSRGRCVCDIEPTWPTTRGIKHATNGVNHAEAPQTPVGLERGSVRSFL